MRKIAVGASSFGEASDKAVNLLLEHGIDIIKNPYNRKLTETETIDHLKDAQGLLAGLETLNKSVLSRAPNLKAIARIGVGMENIDLEYAKKSNIKVSNTPTGPTEAVAEMTVAALMSIGRNIVTANADMHQGIWRKSIGFSISGLNVLIIGYGRIGKRVGEILKYLGANIITFDQSTPDYSDALLEKALGEADVVTLHASGNDEILSAQRLAKLKDKVVILNSARGAMINEETLYDMLKIGKVAYYWGDVFSHEPYSGKLKECENAILTPHIATYSRQCRESMETEAVTNILKDLNYV